MELVYLWVEEYKNIHKQGFNFSPRFECKFHDEYDEKGKLKDNCKLEIIEKKEDEYIKDFFGENINVTAIVGKNGSGKSNILEFISIQNKYVGLYVFYCEPKIFIYHNYQVLNVETKIPYEQNPIYRPTHDSTLLYIKSYFDINNYKMDSQLTIPRIIFKFSEKQDYLSDLYKNTVELFNIVSINSKKGLNEPFLLDPYSTLALDQHFNYLKEKYLHKVLKYYPDLENFIGKYFKVDKVTYKLKDLGSIFLASPDFKDHYKDDEFLNKMFDAFNRERDILNRLKKLCLLFSYIYNEEARKFILEHQSEHNLCDLIEKKGYSNISIWNNFIQLVSTNNDFKIIIKSYLKFIKEIKHEILEFSFSPSLSSGEERLLYLFLNIYDYILNMKKIGVNRFTILIDEPDTLLHPNWQKKFIFLLISFVDSFFRDDFFSFIVTSHSPFLLSDIPKQNIIFLDTYKEDNKEVKSGEQKPGNCKVVDGLYDKQETFGQNIHTLLSDSFFMKDGLMGEFAKSKINEIIRFRNITKKNKHKTCLKKIYNKREKKFRQIQSIVGDPYLQQVLENHLLEIDKFFDKKVAKAKLKARLEKQLAELEDD